MVQPPQSSDLNIMEPVWDQMKRQETLRATKFTEETMAKLVNYLMNSLYKTSLKCCFFCILGDSYLINCYFSSFVIVLIPGKGYT